MKETDQDQAPLGKPGVETIARRLTGELICIGCGYNLRGLSIREVCPECGASIRATLLGVVDPQADELEELSSPWIVGNGLVVWSTGALVAALAVWVLRIDEIIRAKAGMNLGIGGWVSMLGVIGLVCSGIGAMTMVRLHRRRVAGNRWASIRAAIGVSAYIPMVIMYWVIYRGVDASAPMPLINPGSQHLDRSVLRLGMFVGVVVITVGLRPNALKLAMRSVIMRTGRVDRQSLYALLASFTIAAVGDLFHVVGVLGARSEWINPIVADLMTQLHVVLVAMGSVLITLGIVNVVIDTVRLRPVLMHRGVGLSDVFETNRQKAARVDDS
ncbi:MAG: hypothetical protein JJ974_05180 [Phycisphaerales bacterium]|nr:hypothetical protein [Phycisphaerales bacterium]